MHVLIMGHKIMARRGFLAELHRQAMRAARERERAQRASLKAYTAAIRVAEAAKRQETQARVRAHKAAASELKRLEKEAKLCHEAAMEAEVECMNLQIAEIEEDLAGILVATLGVDDFVDLNTLKVRAEHPEFDRTDLLKNSPPPLPVIDAPRPELREVAPPRGIMSIFRKGAYEKEKAGAVSKHESDLAQWELHLVENQARRAAENAAYEERERQRLTLLQAEKDRYAAECVRREEEAAKQNREVDDLITNLGYGTSEAIEEYINIVLANAVYPDHFPIRWSFSFDPSQAELSLIVAVISPDQLPTVKGYKYSKSSDEITPSQMSAKACKDRYTNAIEQVSLRVPHEIFESDRRGLIGSISMQVGTHANDPATGQAGFIPLIALAVDRAAFMRLDLANVQPSATLAHLGAATSKNPYGLVPAKTSGVRRS